MRDFIHINDCVSGILETMDSINDADALNLSTGIYTSFEELILLAAGCLGFMPKVQPLSTKPEGVFARAGCTIKQKSFGFMPTVKLRSGIEECICYFEGKL